MEWTTSSFCKADQPMCVQVRHDQTSVYVRDSKHEDGAVLTFTRLEWLAFLAGARAGEFDLSS